MEAKEITIEVMAYVNSIEDIASAKDLKWAAQQLSNAADTRHEAEKTKG